MHRPSATELLGGLSPQAFMRRHWQKQPLLVRQAFAGGASVIGRARLFALAGQDGVESRLVVRRGDAWSLRQGPLPRRALPPLAQPDWTLLVQGVDLHDDAAHDLLARFRFVPDARLDDLMISWASDGGGVGPHVDSYDVFLLQLQGRRRWRIGRAGDQRLRPDVPLKILADFVPQQEWLLEAGDLLYLPPGWAHDGVAQGECMTASIGFRAAGRDALALDVLQRLVDGHEVPSPEPLYRDPGQPATAAPACIPPPLADFAVDAVRRLLAQPHTLERALGEVLSEPKPGIWFDGGADPADGGGVALDRRTRMLYDSRHVFINGESYRAGGRDAGLMHRLADERRLAAREVAALGVAARELLSQWTEAGWLHASAGEGDGA